MAAGIVYGWGGPRVFVGGPAYYAGGYGGCYVRRLVPTPWGLALAAGEPLLLIRFEFPERPGRRAGAFSFAEPICRT